MPERYFLSDNGSKVREYGKHGLAFDISFDWFEEGACIEAGPTWDREERCIVASCECCDDSPFTVELREVSKEEYDAA
jgi:hypothetical protein